MVLRKREPNVKRAFRVPALPLVGGLTILGCLFLFFNLPYQAMIMLPVWSAIGILVYLLYSRGRSHMRDGHVEVHEPELAELEPDIPGLADRGRD